MRRILNFIIIVLLISVLLFVCYSKYIKKDKVIDFFGYKFLVVLTGSMEPEIPIESLIIIKGEDNYDVRRCCNIF